MEEKWSASEFIRLIWLNLKVKARNFVEFLRVVFRYYSNCSFFKADLSLRLMYIFHNPFLISKRFLISKKEKNIHAYGETPLTTMQLIAQECGLDSKDTVFELGSGRGRVCFWLRSFIHCKVVGIEHIPEFVERANRIRNRLNMEGIEFRWGDFLNADFSGATVIYLYGSCLEDDAIRTLADHLKKLPRGTKIITVSYSISSYIREPVFETMKCFLGKFPWGEADVYLQVLK